VEHQPNGLFFGGFKSKIGYLLIKLIYSGYIVRANKGTVAGGARQFVSPCSDIAVTGAVGGGSILFEKIEF